MSTQSPRALHFRGSFSAEMIETEPNSLRESFAFLYHSSHLGVAIAREIGVLDANDAFLHMIGRTRDELDSGLIDWWGMTPEPFRQLDLNAMEQLHQFGTCVPFEKEFILADGSRLPLMIGAVRLSEEPLTWAAYAIDLREHHKAEAAERQTRELKAKNTLINHLAHELNNPLAALMFLLHLLSTRPDVRTEETSHLLLQATHQLERISHTVRQVLTASQNGA